MQHLHVFECGYCQRCRSYRSTNPEHHTKNYRQYIEGVINCLKISRIFKNSLRICCKKAQLVYYAKAIALHRILKSIKMSSDIVVIIHFMHLS